MRRLHRPLSALLVLLAIATNCIQSGQISLDPEALAAAAINPSDLPSKGDFHSPFVATETDDSGEAPNLISMAHEIPVIKPALSLSYQPGFKTDASRSQSMILRI